MNIEKDTLNAIIAKEIKETIILDHIKEFTEKYLKSYKHKEHLIPKSSQEAINKSLNNELSIFEYFKQDDNSKSHYFKYMNEHLPLLNNNKSLTLNEMALQSMKMRGCNDFAVEVFKHFDCMDDFLIKNKDNLFNSGSIPIIHQDDFEEFNINNVMKIKLDKETIFTDGENTVISKSKDNSGHRFEVSTLTKDDFINLNGINYQATKGSFELFSIINYGEVDIKGELNHKEKLKEQEPDKNKFLKVKI